MDLIRRFTDRGIETFDQTLNSVESGELQDLPANLLTDDVLTSAVSPDVIIEPQVFVTKYKMVDYLFPRISLLDLPDKLYDVGLLTWLTAYYFDSICPKDKSGKRNLRQRARYVTTDAKNWRRYYKHQIALPLRLFASHGDLPKVIFCQSPSGLGDFDEELGSRQEIAMSKGILESADILYWDSNEEKAKRGATTRNKPGTLRRFITIIQQLEVNYDLHSMTGNQIVELFPKHEFSKWLST